MGKNHSNHDDLASYFLRPPASPRSGSMKAATLERLTSPRSMMSPAASSHANHARLQTKRRDCFRNRLEDTLRVRPRSQMQNVNVKMKRMHLSDKVPGSTYLVNI